MGIFKIKADRFEWIGGVADDPQDLCLHGRVTVQFGDTVVEDTGTVSATALYLLKTLTEDNSHLTTARRCEYEVLHKRMV